MYILKKLQKKVDKWKNVCYNIQYIQDKEFK